MIKCGDKLEGKPQCILYSKNGDKVLGRFPYSKHGGEKGAKAAAHKREGQVQFFKKKALVVAADKHGAVEVMKFLADQVGCDRVAETIEKAKKEKLPFGGSFSRMWKEKFGGSVEKCMKMVKGKVDDPGAYCAKLKDKALKRTTWRGKGKHEKKSFKEEAEEALSMLYKEETEPNEDKTNLDEMLDDVSLKDLENWLAGLEQPEEPAEPEPEPEPGLEPTPEPEPEPDSAEEELQEVLREFDEESTFRNLVKWRFGGGAAPVLEEE